MKELKMKDCIKFAFLNVLTGNNLINAIKIIYFINFNISNSGISLLKVILTSSIFLFEIPTGMIADKSGYKISMIWGSVLFSIQALVYIFIPNLIGFIISQVVLGTSYTLFSGALDAYIFGYLGNDNNYVKQQGRVRQFSQWLTAVLVLGSSLLYTLNSILPFVFSAIMGMIGVFVLLTLPNTVNNKINLRREKVSFGNELIDAFKILFLNKEMIVLITISSLVYAFLIFNFEYFQYFYIKYNIPQFFFGVLYFLWMTIAGFGFKVAYKFKEKFKSIFMYVVFIAIVSVSFLSFYFNLNLYIVLGSIAIQEFIFGIGRINIEGMLLSLSDNNSKATVMSCFSMVESVIRAIVTLIFSLLLIVFSIEKIYGLMAILLLIFGIVIILILQIVQFDKRRNDNKC